MYDIIIRNGTVIDGTGRPMSAADIAIKDDTIREIGYLAGERAEQVVDASGCYVVPGFVDIHNHSDTFWRIFSDANLESLVRQGITTIIGGNCGLSLAPLGSKKIFQTVLRWADDQGINVGWLKMKEFMVAVEKRKMTINFGTLVGYDTLWQNVVREPLRQPTADEIRMMEKILDSAMAEGALGLSVGLNYHAAHHTGAEQIASLATVAKKRGGLCAIHLRSESHGIVKAVAEAIEIAERSRTPIEVSHFQVMGKDNWPLQSEALALLESAHARGLDIAFDVSPYTLTTMALYSLLPHWVIGEGIPMMLVKLRDTKTRELVAREMREHPVDYGKIILSVSPFNRSLTRTVLSEIAEVQEKTIEDTIFDLLLASGGRTIVMMETVSEDNLMRVLSHPMALIASNGAGYDINYSRSGNLLHPRNFGAFPRVLNHYVRERRALTWESAIYKMTGKPAKRFGLSRRGTLQEGNYADIVVLDPATIEDCATLENPYRYSTGIQWMFVNGETVIENGSFTGRRAGTVLKRH